ncbi:Carboxylic ester hydrolase [Aphelenchoides bicaudatus]|nr:Carboxylic ester hydrolase [Aphelenchoides bicaudatus]
MLLVEVLFEMARLYAWNFWLVFQFLFASYEGSVSIRPSEVVRLKKPNSQIQGKTYTFEDGREASAFLGIPYAKPPTGQLRFKRSEPTNHWLGVKQTTNFGNRCFYYTTVDYGIKPSEDCLFLNVFAPGSSFKKRKELLPIAFYIHGGSFQSDNAGLLGDQNICRYLNSKDVIVVTFNYRLQFFGFLAIDEDTPGNNGLFDMALALEWIKDNAESFGGDPNKITVFGQSAGAMSTDLFTLSPHTRDLFDKAIMFAGTKNVLYSVSSQFTVYQNALSFAEKRGFRMKSGLTQKQEGALLLKWFKEMPAENITIGWHPVKNEGLYLTSPVMDNDFFPKPLDELRKEAPRKRTITGITEYEGLLFLTVKPKEADVYEYVKAMMGSSYFYPAKFNETILDDILQTFVDLSLPHDSLEFYKQCATVLSDWLFNYATFKTTNIRVALGETAYLYRFTYFKTGTLGNTNLIPFKAATHTLELPYVFGKSILVFNFNPDEKDNKKIEEFTTFLTNFMKTGDPGNKWLPYDPKSNNYYWFGQNSTQDGTYSNFCDDRMLKWQRLYDKWGIEC